MIELMYGAMWLGGALALVNLMGELSVAGDEARRAESEARLAAYSSGERLPSDWCGRTAL